MTAAMDETLHVLEDDDPGLGGGIEMQLADLNVSHSGLSSRVGINASQVRVLSETAEAWPPILVMRSTGEIVDGLHRYQAAKLLGRKSIRCVFFDGSSQDAFIESLRCNVCHGLPLSLRERERAAARVHELHREWSDRKIAAMCGLAPSTVRRIRGLSTVQNTQLEKREGIDGRMRAVDNRELRRQTELALRSRPQATLCEIAALVGASPTTVSRVRADLAVNSDVSMGDDLGGSSEAESDRHAPVLVATTGEDVERRAAPVGVRQGVAGVWASDAALRATPSAAAFSAWFSGADVGDEWSKHVAVVPLSRVYEIADEARRRAKCWTRFAEALELRTSTNRTC
jgi:hypothetical protein